jgi:hypothetical protein
MREWVWIARHLRSAPSYDEWLLWPRHRQSLLRQELTRSINESNALIEEAT